MIIKIGAVLSADLDALFAPLEARANKAADRVSRAFSAASGRARTSGAEGARMGAGGPYRSRAESSDELRQVSRAERDKARVLKEAHREIERDLAEHNRARKRLEAEAARESAKEDRKIQRFGRRVGNRMGAAVSGAFGTATGIAREIAGGAGIGFDVGGAVGRRFSLEKQAQDVANSGYMQGDARNGRRVSSRELSGDVAAVGQKYALDNTDVMGGLQAFVGKTGDLDLGRRSLEQLAATAKATGADFEDVANAAGAISNKLGDMAAPEKAKAIHDVMMALAGQGKVGAVEIKDLATQMEKLTSQASKFTASEDMKQLMGGNAMAANIATMGVLAQAARRTEKGSAAQATQSAMAFIRDVGSDHTGKRLADAGVNVWADKGHTTQKAPEEVISDILAKAGGDQKKLAHMLPNQNSAAVVRAFNDDYMRGFNSNPGGSHKDREAAGRAAVAEAMDKLARATISQKEQDESLALALGTTEAKAKQFQQRLDAMVGDMASDIMPKLLELAPAIAGAAGAFTAFISWAGSNPWSGVGLLVGASLAKAVGGAAVETVVAAGMTKLIAQMGLAMAGGIALAAITVAAGLVYLKADQVKTFAEGKTEGDKDAALLGKATKDFLANDITADDLEKVRSEVAGRSKKAANHDFSAAGVLDAYNPFSDGPTTKELGQAAGRADALPAIAGQDAAADAAKRAAAYGSGDMMYSQIAGAFKAAVIAANDAKGTGGEEGTKAAVEILRRAMEGELKVRVTNPVHEWVTVDGSGRTESPQRPPAALRR